MKTKLEKHLKDYERILQGYYNDIQDNIKDKSISIYLEVSIDSIFILEEKILWLKRLLASIKSNDVTEIVNGIKLFRDILHDNIFTKIDRAPNQISNTKKDCQIQAQKELHLILNNMLTKCFYL